MQDKDSKNYRGVSPNSNLHPVGFQQLCNVCFKKPIDKGVRCWDCQHSLDLLYKAAKEKTAQELFTGSAADAITQELAVFDDQFSNQQTEQQEDQGSENVKRELYEYNQMFYDLWFESSTTTAWDRKFSSVTIKALIETLAVDKQPLDTVTPEYLQRFLLTDTRVNQMSGASALHNFFGYLEKNGFRKDNPSLDLVNPRRHKYLQASQQEFSSNSKGFTRTVTTKTAVKPAQQSSQQSVQEPVQLSSDIQNAVANTPGKDYGAPIGFNRSGKPYRGLAGYVILEIFEKRPDDVIFPEELCGLVNMDKSTVYKALRILNDNKFINKFYPLGQGYGRLSYTYNKNRKRAAVNKFSSNQPITRLNTSSNVTKESIRSYFPVREAFVSEPATDAVSIKDTTSPVVYRSERPSIWDNITAADRILPDPLPGFTTQARSTRVKVLAAFLTYPDIAMTEEEIAKLVALDGSHINRIGRQFIDLGFVRRHRVGNKYYYALDTTNALVIRETSKTFVNPGPVLTSQAIASQAIASQNTTAQEIVRNITGKLESDLVRFVESAIQGNTQVNTNPNTSGKLMVDYFELRKTLRSQGYLAEGELKELDNFVISQDKINNK